MIEMTLPEAKVRASLNGALPTTPKALGVYKDAATFVISMYGLVDMGLANGCLCSKSTAKIVKELLKADGMDHLDAKEVIARYKGMDRVTIKLDHRSNWQMASAYKYIEACVRTCSGIDFN